jgi:DHA1 family multidrug resistance protein-like MFS transporter
LPRGWRSLAALFFTTSALESMAMGHLSAFTPLYLKGFGLAPDEVARLTGLLAALMMGVAFPLAPLWGALAERYSRKLVIVRSQYIEAVAYTLCAISPNLAGFFVARLVLGLTFGNIAIVIATQSLLTPDRRMASAIALVQGANPIAMSIGPPLGALILPLVGLRGLFLTDGLACLLAAVLVTLFMPEPPGRNRRTTVAAHLRGSIDMVWRRPVMRWNFLAWYLTRGSMGIVDTYLPVRIGEVVTTDPAPAIGGIVGLYGFLTATATWTTGRIVDRFGPARLFWPAMLVACSAAIGIALSPVLWLLAVCAWLRSVPIALTNTVLYAHLAQVVRREERAPIMSLTPVPRNVAQFSLPLLAAAFAGLGASAALLVGAATYAAAAGVGWLLEVETRRVRQTEREVSLVETPP